MAIDITRAHHLNRADARALIEDVADHLSRRLGLKYGWEGDRLLFKATGVKGFLEVDDGRVHVHVKKGRVLPLSESWIRQQVEEELDRHLAPQD